VNVPPQHGDKELLNFLAGIGRPTLIVGTKSDRLSGNQLRNSLQILAQDYPEAHILPYSAKTGGGRQELWQEIRQAVDNHNSVFSRQSSVVSPHG
jgi:GTP-binding protein